ncbi:hypothetical protein ETAA8_51410 [Anatilimnocola aggregata]|uniref:Uncharacterized protein n=1 Tax=Anatilimnocola aggregata TaxID=2528021 RepID=A0A517YIG4_9BACT|nr:hypothetical protein [Anatilimnocola aggregata]QDU30023.1 hypothetical protein ETAA8_51410 [Anatilimnocola aggregata]
MLPQSNRISELSPLYARWVLVVLSLVAVVGGVASWNRGKLPVRDVAPVEAAVAETPDAVAPDLQLYRDMVDAVRRGENYYVAAKPKLIASGFPVRSTFNWRLPTYAWLFALLPGPWAIQALLVLLAVVALVLHFQAEFSARGMAAAVVSSFLLLGVVKWSVDGLAFYTQELWASVLILLSIAAMGKGWQVVAIIAGITALMFRELALPFVFWAGVFAVYHRRWSEAFAWAAGITLFVAFLYWHSQQVAAQLTPADLATNGGGISQWLKFGGLDFVLLTARMNSFLFTAIGPVLFLYLLLGLLGLLSLRDERLNLQFVAAASYLAAFCLVGMEVNFYWGLLYAPLLPAGIAAAGGSLSLLWDRAHAPAAANQE